MDAETKQHLDSKFAELLTALNAGFSRLERGAQKPENIGYGTEGEVEDRLLSWRSGSGRWHCA